MNRFLKRSVSTMLIFALLIVTVFAYSDTKGHYAEQVINKWSEYGILKGSGDYFRPNDPITRAEFGAILNRVLVYPEGETNPFSDIAVSDWFYQDVVNLNAAGIMQGSGGKANPRTNIARQEAATLMARAFDLRGGVPTDAFKDAAQIASWAKEAVDALASRKIISGFNGSFRPQANLTRAEAAVLFNNVAPTLAGSDGLSGKIEGSVILGNSAAIAKDTVIEGNLYIAPGALTGDVNLNNVTVTGKIIILGHGSGTVNFQSGPYNSVHATGGAKLNAVAGASVKTVATAGAVSFAGSFGTISTEAESQLVLDGPVDTLTINHTSTVENKKSIATLNLNARATITGTGTIGKTIVAVAGGGSSLAVKPGTLTLPEGVTITVEGKEVTGKGTGSGSGSTGDTGGGPGPVANNPVFYTSYAEAINKLAPNGAPGIIKAYLGYLTDPTYTPRSDNVVPAWIETFVSGSFSYEPSLFPAIRNVSASALSADRKYLWVGTAVDGLFRMDVAAGTEGAHYTTTAGHLLDDNVKLIAIAENAGAWVVTGTGVAYVPFSY